MNFGKVKLTSPKGEDFPSLSYKGRAREGSVKNDLQKMRQLKQI